MTASHRIEPAQAPPAPTGFARRGACPALTAPMMTGDGLLVRVNTIGGSLTPTQLAGLCELAQRHGNGIVEVTARGSFQIRGLTEQSAQALAVDVNALAIPVRTGVPIDLSALAGLDPDEIADARPLVDRLRTAIDAAGLASRLGPKVSVVVDGGGHSGVDRVAGDVRLTAVGPGTWSLAISGDAASARPAGVFGEADAAKAAIAVLTAIADMGTEARGRDFISSGLPASLRSMLPPSNLPDISPARGEISRSGASQDSAPFSLVEAVEAGVISPLVGEMSGRTEGGAKDRDELNLSAGDVLGLTDSRIVLAMALPFGSADANTLVTLTQRAIMEGVDDIRLAPSRQLLLLCPSQVATDALRSTAATLGFITSPADPRSHIAACPGKPACASGFIATRTIARDIAERLIEAADATGRPIDADLSIHISGCAKGCARPAVAAITIVGDEKGAGLVVAGTAKDRPVTYTPQDKAARGIERLADALAQRRPNEDVALTLARLGSKRTAELFAGNDHDCL